MTAKNQDHPRLTLRVLLAIIAVSAVVLGAAAQVRNLVWWVLMLGSFYLPFVLLCLYVRRKRSLIVSVVVLHTLVLILIPLAMWVRSGAVEPLALFALIAFIDVPLLPLYDFWQPHPYVGLPFSIVVGGLLYALIAYGLFRLR